MATSNAGWTFLLNGSVVSANHDAWQTLATTACTGLPSGVDGCLTQIPEGLFDIGDYRAEDITYFQRDGVRHYEDYFAGRSITLQVSFSRSDCDDCGEMRRRIKNVIHAWGRACDEDILYWWPDCSNDLEEQYFDLTFANPMGVRGRARAAELTYLQGGRVAEMTLRFDTIDHSYIIMDDCGVPVP